MELKSRHKKVRPGRDPETERPGRVPETAKEIEKMRKIKEMQPTK